MPRPPLDELYLTWLYRQVGSVNLANPAKTYWRLLRQLYVKEFLWYIPNDDNRAADGIDLRKEFIRDEGLRRVDPIWMELGCSMLEMTIALSRRLAFQDEGEPRDWFWHLMDNINLKKFNDKTYSEGEYKEEVEEALDHVIWRTYEWNGRGGLFPLSEPDEDQRDVELWNQLSLYILEGV